MFFDIVNILKNILEIKKGKKFFFQFFSSDVDKT